MAISRNQLVKELEPGLNALFGLEYNRYENQHEEIFTKETSDRAFEEEVMLSGFANASVKPEGSAATAGTYISNKYQDLLLYGCLVEAYGYLKGPADMLQYYEGSFRRALQSYAIEQQGRRRRDEYQDGAIRTPLKSESPSKY